MGAASTVGGSAINTDGHIQQGVSGTLFAGATWSAGQCYTGGVSFTPGQVSVGMAVVATPEAAPVAGLVPFAYVDAADHVTISVCDVTSSGLTWASGSVFVVRVIP
jgi:hypothetical protein